MILVPLLLQTFLPWLHGHIAFSGTRTIALELWRVHWTVKTLIRVIWVDLLTNSFWPSSLCRRTRINKSWLEEKLHTYDSSLVTVLINHLSHWMRSRSLPKVTAHLLWISLHWLTSQMAEWRTGWKMGEWLAGWLAESLAGRMTAQWLTTAWLHVWLVTYILIKWLGLSCWLTDWLE